MILYYPLFRDICISVKMRYFIDFGYGVLFKGNGLAYVWHDILDIMLMGILLFVFSRCGLEGRYQNEKQDNI